jgi:hypothetical protein
MFIKEGASAEDCVQGDLGDCWLMSALSVAANKDELIIGGVPGVDYQKGMVVDKEMASACSSGVFPPIFHKYRARGIFCLRFMKDFQWTYVIVDSRIPCKKEDGKWVPIFGSCTDDDEMWVQLTEKAYAKLHGCYGNLISGYIDEGIQELTGFQPMKIPVADENTREFPHKSLKKNGARWTEDDYWEFLK